MTQPPPIKDTPAAADDATRDAVPGDVRIPRDVGIGPRPSERHGFASDRFEKGPLTDTGAVPPRTLGPPAAVGYIDASSPPSPTSIRQPRFDLP